VGREQNPAFWQPATCVRNDVANSPALIVEVELLYLSDLTVTRRESEVFKVAELA
jgi:hypothetical protein